MLFDARRADMDVVWISQAISWSEFSICVSNSVFIALGALAFCYSNAHESNCGGENCEKRATYNFVSHNLHSHNLHNLLASFREINYRAVVLDFHNKFLF